MPSNRLINEKSPYLLQHAHNPVDWFPWGEEAFNKAVRENKPVFLSIGYSTCHWCHVMEKESFEDNDVAKLINNYFVPIKVDREERPDIDGVYMTVCQMLTGSGGWPLTIIMTPEKKPFFAGTYFPKENRFGRSGIIDVLQRITNIWESRKEDVVKSADEITNALHQTTSLQPAAEISIELLDYTYADLSKRYDSYYGGFGNAPKFPTPHNLNFLLRYWHRTKDSHALDIVEKTLLEMRKGGIYDHIGYGFHRYSTDRKWLVPHFEKMLYDQALITPVYIEAYQATKNSFYKQTAEEILTYVLRDMTSPEGGFYSAKDADSEGIEGKFYLWKEGEIKNILKDDAQFFLKVFNVTSEGNWIDPMHGSADTTNIIHLEENYTGLAEELKISESELKQKMVSLSDQLFKEREKRIPPYKDDKILTDWNALMISAFADGYRVFGNEVYLNTAEKAAEFILNKLTSGDRLLHRYREGESGLPAHLDDYAFFIKALIDLYECTFKTRYLQKAIDFMELLIKDYWDESSCGFYFTSNMNNELIARQKDLYDGAIPSGNSAALLSLLRLSRIINNNDYEIKAMAAARLFASAIKSSPAAYTYAASALEFALAGSYEIIIAGNKEDQAARNILRLLNEQFIPNKIVILFSPGDNSLLNIAPYLKDYIQKENKITIYVCKNYQCSLPVHTADEMLKLLGTNESSTEAS